MAEEEFNALLSIKGDEKEQAKLKVQIETRKKKLAKVSQLLPTQQSAELSIAYLLMKRELDRLERLGRIRRRERQKEAENEWVLTGNTPTGTNLQPFQEITRQYYSYFPTLSFTHRDVPLEYYSHVQAVTRCGVVEIGENLVETEKDALYFVRKKDVAHLITSGLMKVVAATNNRGFGGG